MYTQIGTFNEYVAIKDKCLKIKHTTKTLKKINFTQKITCSPSKKPTN